MFRTSAKAAASTSSSGLPPRSRAVPGLRVLDVQSDATHNRSVFTLAGDAAALSAGIPVLFERALADIDLRTHKGEHPRLGAVDVVPFIPIDGVTMADCVHAGASRSPPTSPTRFELPVFLYEDASSNPARKNLEDIRRGEFEGLAAKMAQPEWAPDFGPAAPHPSAGASVIGARMPLIAYNINLATNRLDVAKKIAAAIRMSSGGLRYVKAMGIPLEDRGIVQVSMNLTNYEKTPIFRVFDLVKREAERYGVSVLESEIVGLVPAAALRQSVEYYLQLEGFSAAQVAREQAQRPAPRRDAERAQLLVQIRCARRPALRRCATCCPAAPPASAGCSPSRTDRALRTAARTGPCGAGSVRHAVAAEEAEVLRGDGVAADHDHQPLDHVAQLAHVARPAVLLQPRRGLGRQPLRPPAVLGGQQRHEMLGEHRDVLLPIAQRAARRSGSRSGGSTGLRGSARRGSRPADPCWSRPARARRP